MCHSLGSGQGGFGKHLIKGSDYFLQPRLLMVAMWLEPWVSGLLPQLCVQGVYICETGQRLKGPGSGLA